MRWLSTILGILEYPIQYKHCGFSKKGIEEDFGKTRGSTIAVLNWIRAFDGLQRVEVVFRYGGGLFFVDKCWSVVGG